ncbi:MAG: hypothetical protein AB7K09_13780 [Planctomycetota bacterium]
METLYDVYYEKYCLLWNLYGAERRHLPRPEYEALDQELLQLINRAQGNDLTMAEITRMREIEYLLLDDIAEGFYK